MKAIQKKDLRLKSVHYFSICRTGMLFSGIMFSLRTRKSDKPEQKLRGIFLMIAFVSYVVGAAIDAITELDWLTLILQRSFQIFSIFTFYLAFILPEWIKKAFIK